MGLTKSIADQARKPKGKFGKAFARLMNTGHSQLTRWGLSHIPIGEDFIILDVGCGGGKTINQLAGIATKGKIYGIDYSETSIAVATCINKKYIDTGHVEITHASVDSLPFSDNMFDMVTAIETYFFWPNLVKNLREIRRVLKTGGHLLLINEAYRDDRFEKRNAIFSKAGNFTYHSPYEFKDFFKDAGYVNIHIDLVPSKNWITVSGEKDDN